LADAKDCPLGHGRLLNNSAGRATFCRVCQYDWWDTLPIREHDKPTSGDAPTLDDAWRTLHAKT
jgi:hypothetical protein